MLDTKKLSDRLKQKEGLRLKPYQDSVGVLTIGYGHNLQRGISQEVAEMVFAEDLYDAIRDAWKLPFFHRLDDVRKAALVEMVFNMGLPRLQTFKQMLGALAGAEYDRAAVEALDSKWARQVGDQKWQRAWEVAEMFRSGQWV